jgi:hypothetical protein
VFPKDSRFPPFPPFPPVIWRPWTRRRQSVRVVPAAAADRAAPIEEAMLMNIMPILCRRRSAEISHNIAQERQEQKVIGDQNNTFPPQGGRRFTARHHGLP